MTWELSLSLNLKWLLGCLQGASRLVLKSHFSCLFWGHTPLQKEHVPFDIRLLRPVLEGRHFLQIGQRVERNFSNILCVSLISKRCVIVQGDSWSFPCLGLFLSGYWCQTVCWNPSRMSPRLQLIPDSGLCCHSVGVGVIFRNRVEVELLLGFHCFKLKKILRMLFPRVVGNRGPIYRINDQLMIRFTLVSERWCSVLSSPSDIHPIAQFTWHLELGRASR